MAIKVKDEVRKGISYTKREIQDLKELIEECKEAIGYMSETFYTKVANAKRIAQVQDEMLQAQKELQLQQMSLKNYAEQYGLKKSDIDEVQPATDEQLELDWQQDLKEANKPYDYSDLLRLVAQFDKENVCATM